MRVCLVHEEYPEETNFGGIATYQKNVAEELVKQGNEVYVITRSLEKDKNYVENGVNIFRIFVKPSDNQINDYVIYRKKVATILKKLQDENKIDIIEVPDWGAETIYFERYREVPLVVRMHTPLKVWLKYNQNDFGPITNRMLKWEKKMIMAADFITCCSQALKDIIVKEFKINKEILVTPNPANITNFYRDSSIKKEDKLLFVGSLEERKGVCILAQALNIIFEKYPNLKIDFVGKDTTRNSFNKSTIAVIKDIVLDKYVSNLNFVGQKKNSELNYYFNSALVGIFPSLFDNFPYVVLESMITGLHIIGSKNSGMVEMINEKNSIYNTGDYVDLAKKIIDKYELSKKKTISKENINRIEKEYNPTKVCLELLNIYESVIKKYNDLSISVNDLKKVLKQVTDEVILSYKKENGGIANTVFRVDTLSNSYIVKKYSCNYNFSIANELYKIYSENDILTVQPINSSLIKIGNYCYNIFNYVKEDNSKDISLIYLKKLICLNKKSSNSYSSCIQDKVLKYYEYLTKVEPNNLKIDIDELKIVLKKFNSLKSENFISNLCIVHGDISSSNIISNKNKLYLIDFDETSVAFELYEFAMISIKFFFDGETMNWNKFNKLKNMVSNELKNYSDKDYNNSIKYCLCKILLEKYYLYQVGKIDLFSVNQKRDSYLKYLKLLERME